MKTYQNNFTLIELPVVSCVKVKAFTLIELLAVMGIIAILAAMTVGVVGYAYRASSDSKAEATIKLVETALESYKAKQGYYIQQATAAAFYFGPDESNPDLLFIKHLNYEDLKGGGSIQTCSDNNREYLADPFGNAYIYQCPGSHNRTSFDLYSKGADDTDDADDIKNW